MAEHKRNVGSSVLAGVFGAFFVGFAIFLYFHPTFDLTDYRRPVEIGSSALFGAVLFWWACSAKEHEPNSGRKIGFETVTMVVAVVTAVIAILTLTDAAATHKHEPATSPTPEATELPH